MATIKIRRAMAAASIGRCPGSAAAMRTLIPTPVAAKLNAAELATLMDSMWRACIATKALAAQEAIDEGAIWDARRQKMIALTQ